METQKLSARPTIQRRKKPGTASDYICHIDHLPDGSAVVLACRVSSCNQHKKQNYARQIAYKDLLEQRGFKVVDVNVVTTSGFDALWLAPAVRAARELGATAIVAESTDRLIRHSDFRNNHEFDWNLRARDIELGTLRYFFDDIKFATILDPDLETAKVRRWQIKGGQTAKRDKGGRPKKGTKEFKTRTLPKVLELDAAGLSTRAIAKKLGVPRSTVQDWLRKNPATQIRQNTP